jgi:tyrosine-protein phosphatase YwqE
VSAIATDAHNLLHRPPVLAEAREAVRSRYGEVAARMLTETNPAAIIGLEGCILPVGSIHAMTGT